MSISNNVTAKQMFKKLGYSMEKDEDSIKYFKVYEDCGILDTKQTIIVMFVLHNSSIVQDSFICYEKYETDNDEVKEYLGDLEKPAFFSIKEMQAINRQLEELKWI